MQLSVGRPRTQGRKDLPDNLVPRARKVAGREITYFYWRDPRDGKEKPLQCPDDKDLAIQRVNELNSLVARHISERIVQNIIAAPPVRRRGVPFDAWAIDYMRRIEKRKLAPNTMRARKSIIKFAVAEFGARPLHEMAEDVAACSDYIERVENSGRARLALAIRSTLIDVFSEAHAAGAMASTLPNPFGLTVSPKVLVKRARLILDDFKAIWPHCEAIGARIGVWHPNSVLLALVTGQRREDVAQMQFKRGKDWDAAWVAFQRGEPHPMHPYPFIEDGLLWVIQQKTGALVRIPLSLHLDAIGLAVGDVIERCRTNIASRYLLHHTRPFLNAPVGSPVHINTMTRQFAAARNATDLVWEGKTPPTFHELRSLSERLYREQGIDTKTLLGHKHASMTEIYNDPRGAEWGTVGGQK